MNDGGDMLIANPNHHGADWPSSGSEEGEEGDSADEDQSGDEQDEDDDDESIKYRPT